MVYMMSERPTWSSNCDYRSCKTLVKRRMLPVGLPAPNLWRPESTSVISAIRPMRQRKGSKHNSFFWGRQLLMQCIIINSLFLIYLNIISSYAVGLILIQCHTINTTTRGSMVRGTLPNSMWERPSVRYTNNSIEEKMEYTHQQKTLLSLHNQVHFVALLTYNMEKISIRWWYTRHNP